MEEGLSLNLELIFQEKKVKPSERGFSPTGTLLLKDGLKIKNYIQSPGKECKYVVKSSDDLVGTVLAVKSENADINNPKKFSQLKQSTRHLQKDWLNSNMKFAFYWNFQPTKIL